MFCDAGLLFELASQTAGVSAGSRVAAVLILALAIIGSWGVFGGVRDRSP